MVSDRHAGDRPQLSLVIPIYNEEANLESLFTRVHAVLDSLDFTSEVIAVDDGSTDGSLAALLLLRKTQPRLTVVSLARNFGQHAAVLAGFAQSRGEWVVTIDADLQNPPEEIPRVTEALAAGFDLVNTVRKQRRDSPFRRLVSRLNSSFTRHLIGVDTGDLGCMLRGYHRSVVEPITERQELSSFIPALGYIYARRPTEIEVVHEARPAGESKYSLSRLLGLHFDLVTTFSVAPLRALFLLGILIACLAVLFGAALIFFRLLFGASWAGEGVFTLFAVLFFFVGAQFAAFGLLGEYIGRIYLEVRRRPAYLLREVHGPAEREIETRPPPLRGAITR